MWVLMSLWNEKVETLLRKGEQIWVWKEFVTTPLESEVTTFTELDIAVTFILFL